LWETCAAAASFSGPLVALTSMLLHRIPNEARVLVVRVAVVQRVENTGQCELHGVVWAAPVMRERCGER
jgi:hypothetical protein